jgi:hypothetical protein
VLSRAVDAIVATIRPYRRPASCWMLGGAIMASGTAPLAAARLGYLAAVPYLLVAVATTTLAVGCLRAWRGALAVTGVVLGAQVVNVAGALWAVVVNPGGTKAEDLQRMGINPRSAFAVNLVYSSCAVALAIVVGLRTRADRRKSPAPMSTASKQAMR